MSNQKARGVWFSPAVHLLNQLTFPQKFALISLLFAIPLGLVLYFLFAKTLEQVRVAELEIAGVEYLAPLNVIHDDLPQAMSLANAYLQKQPFATEHYPIRQAEIDSALNVLEETDKRLDPKLKTNKRFRVLRSSWEDLKVQIPKLTPEISDDQFQKIIGDVEDLSSWVGDQSTLILDPDLDSYYLMDGILLKLPESASIVSRTRKLVGAHTASGLTESDFNELASQAALLSFNIENLERGLGVCFANNDSGTVQAALEQPLSQYLSSTKALLRLIQETTQPGGREKFSADQYQNSAALVLTSNSRLWERSAEQLKTVLHYRIENLKRQMILVFAVTLVAILVVTYLWIAFYKSIMNTVQALQTATERMKSGEENILVSLETRDELGQVGKAFNDVAQQLVSAGRNYRSIFEGSVDGIFRTDLDGRYLEANSALARIYKYKSVQDFFDHMFRATSLYVDPERRNQFRDLIEKEEVVKDFESEVFCADGSTIWINENARLVKDETGKALYYEGLVQDVTEKKKAEADLQKAIKAAESANQAKSEFLANMSHEIRTPMNAILGFAELLKGLVTDGRQQSYVQAVTSSGQTLLALINDILDLSKIEAGKLQLEYDALDIGVVLRDVHHIFSQKAEQKGLDFLLEISPDMPRSLLLDEIRLRQILFNVVGNAIKFTERGHVIVRAKVGTQNPRHDSIELVLEVEDSGVGIAEDEQQRIFEAFTQQSGQNTKKYGGTGLGLAITKRLVEVMHGQISIRSEKGRGTTFSFSFPEIKKAADTEPRPSFALEQAFDLADLEPCKVLVADDIVMNRDLIRAFFFNTGHEIVEACNGQEAVNLARIEKPDVILMDVRMPVMDGVQATRLIKADEELKDIPIIVITASAMQSEEAALKPICDGFLRKPISRSELAGQMRHFFAVKAEGRVAEQKQSPAVVSMATDPARLADLLPQLQRSKATWKNLIHAPLVSEVEYFGRDLLQLAREYQNGELHDYAGKLTAYASQFDMVSMENTLNEFETLYEDLRREASHQA